jgi:hypothetical protein
VSRKLTTADFIARAREVHGDKYDYSKSLYIRATEKITITCPVHGEFKQRPHNHLNGMGCRACGGNEPLTLETFLQRARDKHGDRYDYSLVYFNNSSEKIDIICPEHGVFSQYVLTHLKGFNCQKCGWESATKARSDTADGFIERAGLVHGDRYDYSHVTYVNQLTKVEIICPEHSSFWQLPSSHIRGIGCSKCSDIVSGQKHRLTTSEFIEKAKALHGDKYDYSKVSYTVATDKVEIICPEHGPFFQSAANHTNSSHQAGCPGCALSGFDQTKPGILYYLAVLNDAGETLYKIGITNLTVNKRFLSADLSRIRVIKTWDFTVGGDAAAEEARILATHKDHLYRGEPVLKSAGNTELFVKDVLGLDSERNLKPHLQWNQLRLIDNPE